MSTHELGVDGISRQTNLGPCLACSPSPLVCHFVHVAGTYSPAPGVWLSQPEWSARKRMYHDDHGNAELCSHCMSAELCSDVLSLMSGLNVKRQQHQQHALNFCQTQQYQQPHQHH